MSKKLLVVNGRSYGEAMAGLGEIVYNPSVLYDDPESVGLVMFTGGADITPHYYGHTSPKKYCCYNEERDNTEIRLFRRVQECGIRSIGICRGVQLLNVMAGGTMIHHVENHGGSVHYMSTSNGELFEVNSLHHQMVDPPNKAVVIGWASVPQSEIYYGDNDELVEGPRREPEAVLFPNINALGVQYHPEMMNRESRGASWFWELARDALNFKDFDSLIKRYLERPEDTLAAS
jgi:gamma-glutamyl-gamma-aminobutyrate hydrolase PuuD